MNVQKNEHHNTEIREMVLRYVENRTSLVGVKKKKIKSMRYNKNTLHLLRHQVHYDLN